LFTEYLRWHLDPGPKLDGVLYPSARTAGHNVVVFAGRSGCLTDAQLTQADLTRDEPQLLLMGESIETRDYLAPSTRGSRRRSLSPSAGRRLHGGAPLSHPGSPKMG
jgi:hypothetical protein